MSVRLRPAVLGDVEACGRVIYAAFLDVDGRHGFASLFAAPEHAARAVRLFIELDSIHGMVAEDDGRLSGLVFLNEGDPIKSIALVAVDPAAQHRGLGRRLMEAAIARAGEARSVRLVQEAYILWGGNLAWGVAETPDDETLVLALGATAPAALRLNVPTRDARLLRWCLDQGLRLERPLTLMVRGWYQAPRGPYFPSGYY